MKTKWLILAVIIAGIALAPSLNASEKGSSGKPAITLGGIWHNIVEKQKELGDLIKDKKLDKVHEAAFAIRDLAKLLPDKSKDLSADNQKKLKSWVDGIADSAKRLDKFGDGGDQANTEKEAKRLDTLLKSIEKLYPPEALKYDGKGAHSDQSLMNFVAKTAESHDHGGHGNDVPTGHDAKQDDHSKEAHTGHKDDSHGDHGAKQGGVLGMQGDYHYELVDRGSEFRVYLYDAYTKPMSVKGIKGSVEIEGQSDKPITLTLAPAADGTYLFALKPKGIDPDEVTLSLNLPGEELMITLLLRTTLSFNGRVVDIACFAKNGAAALESSNYECSRAGIAAGSPVGILHGDDSNAPLYLAVLRGKDSAFRAANENLLKYVNKQVHVTGRLIQRGKLEVLELTDVKPAE